MAIIPGVLPPSRATWQLVEYTWRYFPVVTALQWVVDWYPQGKTSTESRLNLPGKWAWFTMEAPGFIMLLYIMFTLPKELGIEELPWGNWTMAGMFTIHYLYRAIAAPLFLNPSMAPIHVFIWFFALCWQTATAISLGGWLAGYGPKTAHDWSGQLYTAEIGLVLWGWSLLANIYHDDELREIRRAAARREKREAEETGKNVQEANGGTQNGGTQGPKQEKEGGRVYMLPKNGLFRIILYPHYLCEWLEWTGFWMVGGWNCTPARTFLFNEIATMLPRALQGRRWYIEKFGAEKVGRRKAVIPGLL